MISTILSSRLLVHSSISSNLLLILSSIFFIPIIAFFSSDWIFLIFSKFLLKFSCHSSILLPNLVSIFTTIMLKYLSEKLLISISLGFFFLGFIYLEHLPLFSHFVLILCVSYYELGSTATSPSLEGVVLTSIPCVDYVCLAALKG